MTKVPLEWIEYRLMRDIYHCTPSELDAQDDSIIEMHIGIMAAEADAEHLSAQRAKQREKIKNK